MHVYRMEHPADGRGPFRGGDYMPEPDMGEFMDAVKGHRTFDGTPWARCHGPMQELEQALDDRNEKMLDRWIDVIGKEPPVPRDIVFGNSSLKTFDFWFPKRARELSAKWGYEKVVYEVPKERVVVLYTQAAWRSGEAQLVERLKLG